MRRRDGLCRFGIDVAVVVMSFVRERMSGQVDEVVRLLTEEGAK